MVEVLRIKKGRKRKRKKKEKRKKEKKFYVVFPFFCVWIYRKKMNFVKIFRFCANLRMRERERERERFKKIEKKIVDLID